MVQYLAQALRHGKGWPRKTVRSPRGASYELLRQLGSSAFDLNISVPLVLDGAGGWELFADFGRRFDVDMSDFQASLHFGPEAGPNPLLYLYWLIRPSARPRLVPVVVGDLLAAARRGR